MFLPFNTALGLLAGLIGLVVGLATMLLVWWQAPRQHDNQVMVCYLGSVAVWGLAGLLLNLAVVVGWPPQRFHQLLALSIAANSFSTLVLAIRFARIGMTPLLRAIIVVGVVSQLVAVPLIFSERVVVLREVTPDGLFV